MIYKKYILLLVGSIVFFTSCKKDEEPINNYTSPGGEWGIYNPTYVEPYSHPNLTPMHNPEFNKMTLEGIELGKSLYYDNILGTNGNSCSSCHWAQYSYTIPGMGPIGTSVLPHINLGWYDKYGWNGSEEHLDDVPLADLIDGNPFLNANSDTILNRFKRHNNYQRMFWKAFGVKIVEETVQERNKYIAYSLAQFLRTMVSFDSKFDRYILGLEPLTPQEASGLDVFMSENKGDCFHCHGNPYNPLWTDRGFHNTGLNSTFSGVDQGMYNETGNINDMGKFKTPTLRNIELTAPYMHDNRFNTLEEVVDFYSEGLQDSPYIDPLMKKVNQGGVQLTQGQKNDLIAFLKTLTDTSFINNPNFQK